MIGIYSIFLMGLYSVFYVLSTKVNRQTALLINILSLILIFSFFITIVGFRELTAGNDTINYVIAFMSLDGFIDSFEIGRDVFGNSELLFWPLVYILKKINNEPRAFLLFTTILSFILTLLAIVLFCGKREGYLKTFNIAVYSICFLFSTYLIVYFGNHIRASIAVPLAITSLLLYEKRSYKASVLVLLIAIGLHYSSLIIVLFPLFKILISKSYGFKGFIFLSFFTFLFNGFLVDFLSGFGNEYITTKADLYLNSGMETAITSIYTMSSTWVILLISLFSLLNSTLKNNTVVLFFLASVLITSVFPTISIRFFPFLLLVVMPGFIEYSIKKLGLNYGVLFLALNMSIVSFIMFKSESVVYTLGL